MSSRQSLLSDPAYDAVPCGSELFEGQWRVSCYLPCCVVREKPESDEEWEAQRIGVW